MPAHTNFSSLVGARLGDFFRHDTPWTRRLWSFGTVLSLREALEFSEAVASGVLYEAGPNWVRRNATVPTVRTDPALERTVAQQTLIECLKNGMAANGNDYYRVKELVNELEADYMSRWLARLDESQRVGLPPVELTSRLLASHLMDKGLSPRFLRGQLEAATKPDGIELVEFLAAMDACLRQDKHHYKVLVTFRDVHHPTSSVAGWMEDSRVAAWLEERGFPAYSGTAGGLLLDLRARDPYAAVEQAATRMDELAARFRLAGKPMSYRREVFVDGEPNKFSLSQQHNRAVRVPVLTHDNLVYTLGRRNRTALALNLLAELDSSPPGPAASSGWAVIESLLTGPGDSDNGETGAYRLGVIAACALPVTEALHLANWKGDVAGQLADVLARTKTGQDRADAVFAAIRSGEVRPTSADSDSAAIGRLSRIAKAPRAELQRVRDYIARAGRRLYLQRNLVNHGGRTDSVALESTLRNVAPLVGAVVDRLSFMQHAASRPPLRVAAVCDLRLSDAERLTEPTRLV